MRKFSIIFLVLVMIMSMPLTGFAEDIYKDTLRVGLSYGSNASDEAWFYSEGNIDVYDAYYMSYITTVPAYTKFSITNSDGSVSSDYFSPQNTAIKLESSSVIYYNNSGYRGSFELRADGNKITVINIVKTDDYLASLLGKEMSPSWPIEALKAQAVCARNYAMTIAGKHSSYGFDICATVDCQVYGGIKSEADSTRRATMETKGVTVTYKDKVVPLYYFSCDGGYTEDSENVWVSAEGYLRGKKDIYEKPEHATLYNWSKKMTRSEIENVLRSKNIDVGTLTDIRIDEMSDNNGVIKLTFVGTMGEKSVTKTKTRTTLSLNSQAYTIEKHASEPTVREEIETVTQYVLTGDGVTTVTNPKFKLTADGLSEIVYDVVQVEEESGNYTAYTFHGHGWGHLVGMSQWGAYSMAVDGYTYEDILNFYFTDIVIENAKIEEEPREEETEADEGFGEEETEYVEEVTEEATEEVTEEMTEEATEMEYEDGIQRNETGI